MISEFDLKARTWDDDANRRERARVVALAMRDAVPGFSGMKVLEFGCGTGLLAMALRSYAGSIVAVDQSEGMLDVLSEKIKAENITTIFPLKTDLTKDPLMHDRFDAIVSLMALHHVADPLSLFVRFHSMLNLNGWLCMADLDSEDGSFHGVGFTGHNGFDRTLLARDLEIAGFRDVRFSTVHRIDREAADGAKRSYSIFLLTAHKA